MAKLNAVLTIPARITPELQASLCQQTGGTVPVQCAVTWITYMDDEGGIVCKLDIGSDAAKEAFTSITHLRFDPRLPLAREIAAYQKHRVKRLVVSRPDPPEREIVHRNTECRRRNAYGETLVWQSINRPLVMLDRERVGRKASPSAAVIDSQSVKTTGAGGPCGYDAGKRI